MMQGNGVYPGRFRRSGRSCGKWFPGRNSGLIPAVFRIGRRQAGGIALNRRSLPTEQKPGDRRNPEKERFFRIAFTITLASNQIPFQLARILTRGKYHHHLSLPFDAAVPFLPWTFIVYFCGCFIFWFFLYHRVAMLPRQKADRFFSANLLGKGICFLFFVLFPTEMARPELNGSGFWDMCMRFLYTVDEPNNLFPSLHCFIAWFCWAGIRGNREVSAWWRFSALLMAFAVCVSTLTTRQHVLADVAGGVTLSELSWLLAGSDRIRGCYSSLMDGILSGTGREQDAPAMKKKPDDPVRKKKNTAGSYHGVLP